MKISEKQYESQEAGMGEWNQIVFERPVITTSNLFPLVNH